MSMAGIIVWKWGLGLSVVCKWGCGLIFWLAWYEALMSVCLLTVFDGFSAVSGLVTPNSLSQVVDTETCAFAVSSVSGGNSISGRVSTSGTPYLWHKDHGTVVVSKRCTSLERVTTGVETIARGPLTWKLTRMADHYDPRYLTKRFLWFSRTSYTNGKVWDLSGDNGWLLVTSDVVLETKVLVSRRLEDKK